MAKPTAELVQRVLATVQTAEDLDYFFDTLTSPDWIEPLASEGLFRSPPEPVSAEGGGIQIFSWSASRYLARMAANSPDLVAGVIRAVPETQNARVLNDFIGSITDFPPHLALEFITPVVKWLDNPYPLLLPTNACRLMRHLARAGEGKAALRLARAIFRLRVDANEDSGESEIPPDVSSLIDYYEFERLIDSSREDLILGTGLDGLRFLRNLLTQAMGLVGKPTQDHDLSWIWRPAIEPHEQNSIPSVRNSLISAVRDAAVQLVELDAFLLPDVVTSLESGPSPLFRRVALHVLRVAAPQRATEVSAYLLDSSNMFNPDLHHEYWLLLQARFPFLELRHQQDILQLIKDGPPIYRDPHGPYAADPSDSLERWQLGQLEAIAGHLPEEAAHWYAELVEKFRSGEPGSQLPEVPPDFLSYTSGGFVGSVSPITEEAVQSMTVSELVDFLRDWIPEEGWQRPSRQGLSRVLMSSILADPIRYAPHAPEFRDLDRSYIEGFFSAFREAASRHIPFDWSPVLQLAELVVSNDAAGSPGQSTAVRSLVAHLLDCGLDNYEGSIAPETREMVWRILVPLTMDSDPTTESEERYGGSNMDPSTLAINTVRGQALQSVIKFALWEHRNTKAKQTSEGSPFTIEADVRRVLEIHLNIEQETSYAVHSLYGQWFPWLCLLDEDWAGANVGGIFPASEAARLYWDAAWDAYISSCPPYDSVFDLLRTEYKRAVERLNEAPTEGRRRPMLAGQRFCQHLMVLFLRGKLELSDTIVTGFFEDAPADFKAAALGFVGRSMYTIVDGRPTSREPQPTFESVERARELWDWRIASAHEASDVSAFENELVEYGWMFVAPDLEPDWALSNILRVLHLVGRVDSGHLVIQRLAEMATDYPEQVLDVMHLMVQGPDDGWLVLRWKDSVTTMLESLLQNADSQIRDRAAQLTHELGARGYRQLRDLLK